MTIDLISRQAAIDAARDWYEGLICGSFKGLEKRLRALPSAQPSATDTSVGGNLGNLIERQAAKDFEKQLHDMFDHIWDCKIDHPAFQDTVGDLMRAVIQAHNNSVQPEQAAQPEQRWIPWSNGKLPEESGTYTVTAYDGVTKRVTYAKYQKRLKRWELTGARAYWRVLAWMPLPEPYKEKT